MRRPYSQRPLSALKRRYELELAVFLQRLKKTELARLSVNHYADVRGNTVSTTQPSPEARVDRVKVRHNLTDGPPRSHHPRFSPREGSHERRHQDYCHG